MDEAKYNNPEKPTTLGEFVRQHRERRGLRQVELAKLADLSPSVVSQIESGVTPNPIF